MSENVEGGPKWKADFDLDFLCGLEDSLINGIDLQLDELLPRKDVSFDDINRVDLEVSNIMRILHRS